jgi:hypothetical protein
MPALTSSDAFAEAEYALHAETGEALAEALYGPGWRTPVKSRFETGEWYASRHPDAIRVARYLAPLLAGRVAHDGRGQRTSRTSGWWLLGDSSRWLPTDAEALAEPLTEVTEALYRAASEIESSARFTSLRSVSMDAKARHADARLRLAVLESLMVLTSRSGRPLFAALQATRPHLPLPKEALAAIARDWLDEALDLDEIEADASGRVWTEDVSGLLLSAGEYLPRPLLFRGLDLALGGRRKSGPRRYWLIPATPEEALAA